MASGSRGQNTTCGRYCEAPTGGLGAVVLARFAVFDWRQQSWPARWVFGLPMHPAKRECSGPEYCVGRAGAPLAPGKADTNLRAVLRDRFPTGLLDRRTWNSLLGRRPPARQASVVRRESRVPTRLRWKRSRGRSRPPSVGVPGPAVRLNTAHYNQKTICISG